MNSKKVVAIGAVALLLNSNSNEVNAVALRNNIDSFSAIGLYKKDDSTPEKIDAEKDKAED